MRTRDEVLSMSEHLSEADAWVVVAERVLTHPYDGIQSAAGLCDHVFDLRRVEGLISLRTLLEMVGRIREAQIAAGMNAYTFAYPGWSDCSTLECEQAYVDEHREARALAALWFALEAEEEGK